MISRRYALIQGSALVGGFAAFAPGVVAAGEGNGNDHDKGRGNDKGTVVVRILDETDDDARVNGPLLVTDEGLTLYVFSEDADECAECDNDPNSGNPNSEALATLPCTTKWPVYETDADDPTGADEVKRKVGVFDRDDPDGCQVTVKIRGKDLPVYRNVQDTDSGDVNGPVEDSGGEWSVIRPQGNYETSEGDD